MDQKRLKSNYPLVRCSMFDFSKNYVGPTLSVSILPHAQECFVSGPSFSFLLSLRYTDFFFFAFAFRVDIFFFSFIFVVHLSLVLSTFLGCWRVHLVLAYRLRHGIALSTLLTPYYTLQCIISIGTTRAVGILPAEHCCLADVCCCPVL